MTSQYSTENINDQEEVEKAQESEPAQNFSTANAVFPINLSNYQSKLIQRLIFD